MLIYKNILALFLFLQKSNEITKYIFCFEKENLFLVNTSFSVVHVKRPLQSDHSYKGNNLKNVVWFFSSWKDTQHVRPVILQINFNLNLAISHIVVYLWVLQPSSTTNLYPFSIFRKKFLTLSFNLIPENISQKRFKNINV